MDPLSIWFLVLLTFWIGFGVKCLIDFDDRIEPKGFLGMIFTVLVSIGTSFVLIAVILRGLGLMKP